MEDLKILEEIRDDFVNKFDNDPQIKRICNVMINEFKERKKALTIPVVVDMLPKKNSKDFKDWLIDGGYTKTRTKDIYMKGDSGFTTDVLYRHFCNVLTFGN